MIPAGVPAKCVRADGGNGVRLEDIGEFELIDRLTRRLSTRADVVLGAGDDAALLAPPAGALLVATCDAQVEGRHFVRGIATPEEIGRKVLAVNLSDVAAMGARPLWALVSLLLPPALDIAVLDGIYAGLSALAGTYEVAVVGGNVSATGGPLTIDVTLLGTVARAQARRRDAGQPGDAILVTGSLGAAAAGLLALVTAPGTAGVPEAILERARRALAAPVPRVREGLALAATGAVNAMLDISDGLASDLRHLCSRSDAGAEIDAASVPVDRAAEVIAHAYGRDPLALALSGGEDYELLFTVPQARVATALAAVQGVGASASVVGRLTEPGMGIRLRLPDGTTRPLEPAGWDHLRASREGQTNAP